MKTAKKVVFAIAAAGALLLAASCTQRERIKDKDKGTLVWSDEFDKDGVPNADEWEYDTGGWGWGNGERQNYQDNTKESITAEVKDGRLIIKAYKKDGKWVSARLRTKKSFTYGYIEGRMKVTDKDGLWPAFWLLPKRPLKYGEWPASGEIDIMENAPTVCTAHRAFSTLHSKNHHGGEGVSIGDKTYKHFLGNKWHTFAVSWTENEIYAVYDGVVQNRFANDGDTNSYPYNMPFYIILNLAVGGTLGGYDYEKIDAAADKPETFEIDYIRVYQR